MNENNSYKSKDGKTTIIGDPNSKVISRIFIEDNQFAPNDFTAALYRIGAVNEIKLSDIQKGIQEIFSKNKRIS